MIQLQQARMKGANLLLTLSLRLTAVGVTTIVAVGDANVWKLEIFALIAYHYSTATTWITNESGIHPSKAIQPPLTTNLRAFSQIYWQIQHRHMRIKVLGHPLVMPSLFLTRLFLSVSLFLIAVVVTTRVIVDTVDVWKLETLALIVYRYGAATVKITNVVRAHLSWAIQPPLLTKLPTYSPESSGKIDTIKYQLVYSFLTRIKMS